MPNINLASDLVEVTFSPEELNRAEQFVDKDLSIMRLQNMKVDVTRQLATFIFTGTAGEIEQNIRAHIALVSKLELLTQLIDSAYNPTPIPVETANPNL